MRISYQITFFVLTALVAATSFECLPAATMTVTVTEWKTSILTADAIIITASPNVTTTITEWKTSILTADAIVITASPNVTTTANTENSLDYMTISMTNIYGTQLSISFLSNAGAPSPVGNPSATVLPNASPTQYTFPTGWAGRIYVGPNLNPLGSKIEGSFTGPPDIDVSYVDGYSVPITCSSQGIPITGCNIDLFKQPGIQCDKLVDGPVCLNPAQDIPNGPAPPFFAACAGAAYTYPNDNKANVSNLGSKLVSCCIGALCKAPSRQPHKRYNSLNAKPSIARHQQSH